MSFSTATSPWAEAGCAGSTFDQGTQVGRVGDRQCRPGRIFSIRPDFFCPGRAERGPVAAPRFPPQPATRAGRQPPWHDRPAVHPALSVRPTISCRVVLLAVLLGGGLGGGLGACRDRVSCRDCHKNIEYCVRFGSDVAGEDDTFRCEPLPPTCEAPLDCACLDGAEADGFNLPWCLDAGGCEETGTGLRVVCPGG